MCMLGEISSPNNLTVMEICVYRKMKDYLNLKWSPILHDVIRVTFQKYY